MIFLSPDVTPRNSEIASLSFASHLSKLSFFLGFGVSSLYYIFSLSKTSPSHFPAVLSKKSAGYPNSSGVGSLSSETSLIIITHS